MEMNILVTGVGGQGTVLTSRMIAQTAIDLGFMAGTAETIGMAQRGGCVTSHVRIGAKEMAPMIPLGSADLIIAFEPAEACRCLPYLKKTGSMIVNKRAVMPASCTLGKGYEADEMINFLKKLDIKVVFADGMMLCQRVGSFKVLNTIMLGVALNHKMLPFKREDLEHTINCNLPEKVRGINMQALDLEEEE